MNSVYEPSTTAVPFPYKVGDPVPNPWTKPVWPWSPWPPYFYWQPNYTYIYTTTRTNSSDDEPNDVEALRPEEV